MKTRSAPLTSASQFRTLGFAPTNTSRAFWSPGDEGIFMQHDAPSAPGQGRANAPLIYAVDDMPCLTDLYILVLEAAGYVVRAFNDRSDALEALKAEGEKPDLLITDYRGTPMPVERFMHDCVAVHPALRILMATGFDRTNMRFSHVRPDRFIHKPFTPEELRLEVKAVLVR